jgi:hypothetical protein
MLTNHRAAIPVTVIFLLGAPTSSQGITMDTLEKNQRSIEAGICPSNVARVPIIECDTFCPDCSAAIDYGNGLQYNRCMRRLNKLNAKIRKYNKLAEKCRGSQRNKLPPQNQGTSKQHENGSQSTGRGARERFFLDQMSKAEVESIIRDESDFPNKCYSKYPSPECIGLIDYIDDERKRRGIGQYAKSFEGKKDQKAPQNSDQERILAYCSAWSDKAREYCIHGAPYNDRGPLTMERIRSTCRNMGRWTSDEPNLVACKRAGLDY